MRALTTEIGAHLGYFREVSKTQLQIIDVSLLGSFIKHIFILQFGRM